MNNPNIKRYLDQLKEIDTQLNKDVEEFNTIQARLPLLRKAIDDQVMEKGRIFQRLLTELDGDYYIKPVIEVVK